MATGSNFPAGVTVGWNVALGSNVVGSGSFQLDPQNTAFNFTLSTDGVVAGDYTFNFSIAGRVVASTHFTITGTPASSGAAAQFKSQMVDAMNQTFPPLQDVLSTCPGANPLVCQSKYDTAARAYAQLGDKYFAIAGTAPSQCTDLFTRVDKLRMDGNKWFTAPYTKTSQGWIDRGEAVNRAAQARLSLVEAKRVVEQEPGACR